MHLFTYTPVTHWQWHIYSPVHPISTPPHPMYTHTAHMHTPTDLVLHPFWTFQHEPHNVLFDGLPVCRVDLVCLTIHLSKRKKLQLFLLTKQKIRLKTKLLFKSILIFFFYYSQRTSASSLDWHNSETDMNQREKKRNKQHNAKHVRWPCAGLYTKSNKWKVKVETHKKKKSFLCSIHQKHTTCFYEEVQVISQTKRYRSHHAPVPLDIVLESNGPRNTDV